MMGMILMRMMMTIYSKSKTSIPKKKSQFKANPRKSMHLQSKRPM